VLHVAADFSLLWRLLKAPFTVKGVIVNWFALEVVLVGKRFRRKRRRFPTASWRLLLRKHTQGHLCCVREKTGWNGRAGARRLTCPLV